LEDVEQALASDRRKNASSGTQLLKPGQSCIRARRFGPEEGLPK
jgi:hypothetical protein